MNKKGVVICKNCEVTTLGKYCNNCGQRTSIDEVSFKETFQDLVNGLFSINAPFFLTMKMLLINPGKLLREFLKGKRKIYYKPVSFFILTTILYLIVRSLINYDPMTTAGVKVDGEILAEAGKYMVKNINNIMFVFVFTLGVFLKIFFYKKNTLAEFIAIAFYMIGVYTIIGTFFMFYLKFNNPNYKEVPVILFLIYMIYAITSFFRSKSIVVVFKTCLITLFAFIFYILFGFLFSFLIVWIKS
ncbi:DUF3667 domain-containing protein [Tenacibaculum sp. S7007]|uniref:DUF3667 domain-containing protein n=1 Tax=Tenacibaculum pelagium TaxID=2759527 RepID=A0A839AMS5_9FLAO|nr:DUF3667 domain-containing protein [Tenacibaculum pelagium]MBA6155776.1 DUF3667 domain-containing protein [Tenacibaculum pelagium]